MTELNLIIRAAACDIVAAYVSHNAISATDLPGLIGSVYSAVSGLGDAVPVDAPAPPEPAVSVRSSIKPDHITCLHCGKKFKSLKRHLMTHHNQTPQQYREVFGLPVDYPMVAPTYSETRSALAKQSGLGRIKIQAKAKR